MTPILFFEIPLTCPLETRLQRFLGCKTRRTVSSERDSHPNTCRGLFQFLSTELQLIAGQVRTLLSDYLTDEEQGSVAGRNPIASINETLRDGKFTRDRSKVCH